MSNYPEFFAIQKPTWPAPMPQAWGCFHKGKAFAQKVKLGIPQLPPAVPCVPSPRRWDTRETPQNAPAVRKCLCSFSDGKNQSCTRQIHRRPGLHLFQHSRS